MLCLNSETCACLTSDRNSAANCLACYAPAQNHCTSGGLQDGSGTSTAGNCSGSGVSLCLFIVCASRLSHVVSCFHAWPSPWVQSCVVSPENNVTSRLPLEADLPFGYAYTVCLFTGSVVNGEDRALRGTPHCILLKVWNERPNSPFSDQTFLIRFSGHDLHPVCHAQLRQPYHTLLPHLCQRLPHQLLILHLQTPLSLS